MEMTSKLRSALVYKGISQSELRTVGLAITGLGNNEIAPKLNIAVRTVKFHLSNVYKKLNIRSRSELIIWCQRNSVVTTRNHMLAASLYAVIDSFGIDKAKKKGCGCCVSVVDLMPFLNKGINELRKIAMELSL